MDFKNRNPFDFEMLSLGYLFLTILAKIQKSRLEVSQGELFVESNLTNF